MPGGIFNFYIGIMLEAYFHQVFSLYKPPEKSTALQVNEVIAGEVSPQSIDLSPASGWTHSSLENVSANKQSTFNAFFLKQKKNLISF